MDDTTRPSGVSAGNGQREDAGPGRDDRAKRVDAVIARLAQERLEVLPFYHDLRNQIVHPTNLHVETRYFFRKWKPMLGPVLTLLIMELRDRCYYNPRTGERRDYCWPSQEELARAIGVSVRTVIRALQDPLARKFVRVQHRYRYDPTMGKKVRTSSAYVVAMDDPLLPDDDAVLTRMVAEQILAAETAERNHLLGDEASDLDDTLTDRSSDGTERALSDKLSSTGADALTDKLSALSITDKLSEEEVLSRRDTQQNKDKNQATFSALPSTLVSQAAPRDDQRRRGDDRRSKKTRTQQRSNHEGETAPTSTGSATISGVPGADSAADEARTVDDVPDEVIRAYADANDRPPTRLERQRLAELVRRFDPIARQAIPPSTGGAWLRAAIVEAVDSGSAFVAPRRILTICERWAKASETARRRSASGATGGSIKRRKIAAQRLDASVGVASERTEDSGGEIDPNGAPVDPFDEQSEVIVPTFVVSADRPVTNWQLWRLVTDELLRDPVGQQNRAWLEQVALIDQVEGTLVVGTQGRFARDLVERRLGEAMRRAVATILGEDRALKFVVSRSWLESRGS